MNTNLHHLKPPLLIPHLFFSPENPHQLRPYKRRRLKPCKNSNNFLEPFQNLISQFPSPKTLDIVAPALGLASGLTLYLSQSNKFSKSSNIGEWILFSNPTPFNRFVILRCPSISLEGSELLENVNDKLVKEDRHFVRLNSGRIRVRTESSEGFLEEKLEYQRVCVNAEDGGVISIDWPANLELEEEHGLDTTLLLVPGTANGSSEENVRFFVVDALRRGFFPVVMNPRGCAGSPITTARLFTAADSDDISTAVQFISKARPWTTLMGVGWGYGANMLTKYLAEVGGEIFQGRAKGFDVEKALASKSVRDFEKAISMVSYGFEEIEDFYSKSSTRGMVGNVKIPVLFIQSDDGTVPLFSIPRSLIAENPFTSLLLCSYMPSSAVESGRAAVSWCQNLTIEWLAAVELGLLKGRHPLLKDVDFNINPSEGLTHVESRASDNGVQLNKLLGSFPTDASGYTVEPLNKMLQNSTAVRLQSRSRKVSGDLKLDEGLQELENDAVQQTSSVDAELIEQDSADPVDIEKGQVLQTAQVVMNMLDVTMPGTLSEEEKKKVMLRFAILANFTEALNPTISSLFLTFKRHMSRLFYDTDLVLVQVLTAVGQGETLMKALQDAVPEEVRGKLTTAVSGILQAQHTNLKIDRLLSIGKIPNVSKTKIQEKVREVSSAEGTSKDRHSPDQMKRDEDLTDGSVNNQPGTEKSGAGSEQELQKSIKTSQSQAMSSQQGDPSGSDRKEPNESGHKNESDELIKEKAASQSESSEKRLETSSNPNITSHAEKAGGTEETIVDASKVEQGGGMSQVETKMEHSTQKNEEKTANSAADQNRIVSANMTEEKIPPAASTPDSQPIEREGNDDQKRENKTVQPALDQNKPPISDSNPHTFSVTQALDALTGMDDSTQVAVNSVFGVIENMISQYEEETDHENKIKNKKEVEDESVDSKPQKLENVDDLGTWSDTLRHPPIHKHHESDDYLQNAASTEWVEEEPTEDPILFSGKEEGQWKLLEQTGITGESVGGVTTSNGAGIKVQVHSSGKENDGENYIEPSYYVLDTEKQQEPVEEYSRVENFNENVENSDSRLDELIEFVKIVVLDALRIEVGRKLGAANKKEMKSYLARDLELVADAVSLAVGRNMDPTWCLEGKYNRIEGTEEKVGTVQGEHIVKAISSAILRTNYLRRLLPVGVIIGSSLAALRKYFNVATRNDNDIKSPGQTQNHWQKSQDKVSIKEIDHKPTIKTGQTTSFSSSRNREGEEATLKTKNNDRVMVGAVTAALGASALLVQHEDQSNSKDGGERSSKFSKERGNHRKAAEKLEETESEKNQNLVTSLAEKAMSVAGPVVPTKEGGGVDQERLVSMLADLGQKGGILKLVGKIALLWGGIRGAMSLTDRLILFLHLAERSLYQRILGFAGMVLVLWSPVIVPLLPTLVQSWTTNTSSRFAEFVCIVGLYTATMILVVLWGRRVRGYEDPLAQYGLDLTALPKTVVDRPNDGCVSFSWPSSLPSSSLDAMTWLKVYGQMIMLAGRGIITAAGIVLVEELLFRAWLTEEIAADLGYHQGIIISGLAFSLFQRSLWAVPGLWLFSLALAGLRKRSKGSLSVPIGLRTGIMASSFVLQTGGLLTYKPNYPVLVTGTHPHQPFCGAIGLAFSLLLAIILYPRQPLEEKNLGRATQG
ncbi:unnamed protein product [Dovyalis caffra]|uniref:Uncharacterized protein n=1 Tax=Dovyalis caffra TaxID=77055 RepID=A0AAV1SMA2_9ROSI|nr:unnamed protein product [Dovyalis caffra]